jgi:hypothetical protein
LLHPAIRVGPDHGLLQLHLGLSQCSFGTGLLGWKLKRIESNGVRTPVT